MKGMYLSKWVRVKQIITSGLLKPATMAVIKRKQNATVQLEERDGNSKYKVITVYAIEVWRYGSTHL